MAAGTISKLRRHRKTVWVSLLLVGLVIAVAGVFGIQKMQRIHHHLQVVNKTHFVAVSMQVYLEDHGQFPESLESLAADLKLDARAIGPIHDERIVYKQPAPIEADSVAILTVTGHGFETVVTKGFEMKTLKIQGKENRPPPQSNGN